MKFGHDFRRWIGVWGLVCLCVFFLSSVLHALPSGFPGGFQTLALEEKGVLERAIQDYAKRVLELDRDLLKLREQTEWILLRVERFRDRGEPVPASLEQHLDRTRREVLAGSREKERLDRMAREHLDRFQKLHREVLDRFGGEAPAWWTLNPGVTRFMTQPKPVDEPGRKEPVQEGVTPEAAPIISGLEETWRVRLMESELSEWFEVREHAGRIQLVGRRPILFDEGDMGVPGEYSRFMENLARFLNRHPASVRVEGYADSRPVRGVRYGSNWEVAAHRAANVVLELVRRGTPERVFTVVSHGAHGAVADGEAEDLRLRRRVELSVELKTP